MGQELVLDSDLVTSVWDAVDEHIAEGKEREVARNLVSVFEMAGCGMLELVAGPVGWEARAMRLERDYAAPEAPAVGDRVHQDEQYYWQWIGYEWLLQKY